MGAGAGSVSIVGCWIGKRKAKGSAEKLAAFLSNLPIIYERIY